ncbi:MAG: hypothetical protein A2020_04275 [Lentisphaerae bacterium GWF2_45_14]|nr:MAG: hypothetical protein A2020_04275 [Lentisphaerae bacterium GWF2_45_14]
MRIFFIIGTVFLSFITFLSAIEKKETAAVHDFNVTPALTKLNISPWWLSERMENELVQSGKYTMITRARIARVLKEQNISSGPELKPQELGKISGAQYIVTGQADYSGGRINIVVNIIDVTVKAGEIKRSFDISVFSPEQEVASRLPELLEKLAKKLSMTPGEFLEQGLEMMKAGDYERAVQCFQELGREADMQKIASLTKMVSQKQLEKEAAAVTVSGETPGEMLDYGLNLMYNGDLNKAALVFYRLQKSKMGQEIGNLMRAAKHGAKKKEEVITTLIDSARKKFENAIVSRDEKERQKDPTLLCDEAVTELQAFLGNPKVHLSDDEKRRITDLIGEIESFRKKLFAGPSKDRAWAIPGLKMEFIPVAAGSFTSSGEGAKEDRVEHEYTVKITKPFWIGKYEVSVGEFLYYLKSNSGLNRNERFEINRDIDFESPNCPINASYQIKKGFLPDMPMSCISWRGAKKFCEWLSASEKKEGRLPLNYEYRLPTEAEWESGCRAGTKTAFSFGDTTQGLENYAWYRNNTSGHQEKCGTKQPNKWGIYDMHGNLWEWCYDWYSDTFVVADSEDPRGPDSSTDNLKVLRGGSFTSEPVDLQCGSRYCFDFKTSKKNIGFRAVCAPEL